jgi:hypothetical protein
MRILEGPGAGSTLSLQGEQPRLNPERPKLPGLGHARELSIRRPYQTAPFDHAAAFASLGVKLDSLGPTKIRIGGDYA